MTDDFINQFVEHYGDRLADPEAFPQTFSYQLRIFKYAGIFKEPEKSGTTGDAPQSGDDCS
jgi:hypothetical protein